MIGIGLLYRRGYFRQRLDIAGRQQEYWVERRPEEPADGPRSSTPDGAPLMLSSRRSPGRRSPSRSGGSTSAGCRCSCSTPSSRERRRAALDDARASTRATGPCVSRSTACSGSAARGVLAGARDRARRRPSERGPPGAGAARAGSAVASSGGSVERGARARCDARFVFTTHTPVAAGNETYAPEEFLPAFADLPRAARRSTRRPSSASAASSRGRRRASGDDAARDPDESPPQRRQPAPRRGGARACGGRSSRARTAEIPITHVTNGAHLPTFVSEPMRAALARHLGDGWLTGAAEPASWEGVQDDPERGALGGALRGPGAARRLRARRKNGQDSLLRGEQLEHVRVIETRARGRRAHARVRAAACDLQAPPPADPRSRARAPHLRRRAAGAARDRRQGAPERRARARTRCSASTGFKHADAEVAERVVIVEDYDIGIARQLVAGCDLWVNLPRRPMEASGTSGMKATFNGVLQLSVLDGWWAEAYNGANGWAIPGDGDEDLRARRRPRRRAVLRPARARGDPALLRARRATASPSAGATGSRRPLVTLRARSSPRRGWSTTTSSGSTATRDPEPEAGAPHGVGRRGPAE